MSTSITGLKLQDPFLPERQGNQVKGKHYQPDKCELMNKREVPKILKAIAKPPWKQIIINKEVIHHTLTSNQEVLMGPEVLNLGQGTDLITHN